MLFSASAREASVSGAGEKTQPDVGLDGSTPEPRERLGNRDRKARAAHRRQVGWDGGWLVGLFVGLFEPRERLGN